MKQYELWWAHLPEPTGRRPVMLLSRSPAYEYLKKIIIVEVTTRIRSIPQEVHLSRQEGMTKPSVANFDNIHVVAKSVLGDPIGRLAASRVLEVKRALGYALNWPELKKL